MTLPFIDTDCAALAGTALRRALVPRYSTAQSSIGTGTWVLHCTGGRWFQYSPRRSKAGPSNAYCTRFSLLHILIRFRHSETISNVKNKTNFNFQSGRFPTFSILIPLSPLVGFNTWDNTFGNLDLYWDNVFGIWDCAIFLCFYLAFGIVSFLF